MKEHLKKAQIYQVKEMPDRPELSGDNDVHTDVTILPAGRVIVCRSIISKNIGLPRHVRTGGSVKNLFVP